MDKKQEIKRLSFGKECVYTSLDACNDSSIIDRIHSLFANHEVYEPTCTIETFYLGNYYLIHQKYDQMKIHFEALVKEGDKNVMINLGRYYEDVERNFEKAKEYYLMADSPTGINNLMTLYGKQGNTAKSSYYWQKLREMPPSEEKKKVLEFYSM
jgi:TPR repeat protein